ncbi:MAG: YbgS-like family protein [Sodalis sp. (in: enterobacteria)]|uniref:YbgS-like family protein n=1 Tax=Sodalis sp. (in: enterobacteria) TaxID=1898979 RepID=UPI0039E707E3
MQTNISKKMAMLFLTTAMTLGSGAVMAAPGTGSNTGGSDGGVPELQNNAPNIVDNKYINNIRTNTNTTGTPTGTDASGLNKTEQHKNTMCKDGRCPDVNKKVETGTTGTGSPDGTKTDGTTQ